MPFLLAGYRIFPKKLDALCIISMSFKMKEITFSRVIISNIFKGECPQIPLKTSAFYGH